MHSQSGELPGFSTDASHPFSEETSNRKGPFFEFRGKYSTKERRWFGRLVDQNHNGFPEYLDPLPAQTKPYLYASSYPGTGYRVEDLAGAMRDVYRKRVGVPFKPHGFQLISPGADRQYGVGGLYDPERANEILSKDRFVERDNMTNFMIGTLGKLPNLTNVMMVKAAGINVACFVLIAITCKLRWRGLLLLLILQSLGGE